MQGHELADAAVEDPLRQERRQDRVLAQGLNGREAEIMRGSLMYSLGMLAVMCVWTFGLTMV